MSNITYRSGEHEEDGSPSPAFQSSLAPFSTSTSTSTNNTPPTERMLRDGGGEQESLDMDSMDSVVRELKLELAGAVTTSAAV